MSTQAPSLPVTLCFKEEVQVAHVQKGNIYKQGPSWFLQYRIEGIELDPKTNRRKREKVSEYIAPWKGEGKKTRDEARQWANSRMAEINDAKARPMSVKTVAEFVADRFIPDVVWSCKPSGKAHYDYMLDNHVLPVIGHLKMRNVKPEHVQAIVRAKIEQQKLSVQTAVHVRNCISAIFRHAKRMRAYAGDLPTEGVRLPALQAAEKRALTWAQVQALASHIGYPKKEREQKARGPRLGSKVLADKYRADNQQLGALVIILSVTGLRIGEAMGLRWKRVNLTDKDVTVDGETLPPYAMVIRENYVRGNWGTLKTKRSLRPIPLTSDVLAAFARLTKGEGDSPVFASRNGTPLDQHNIASRFLKPAGIKAGCPWVSWHVLRHTAASLADRVGVTVAARQKVLGHAAASTTIHYTHAELDSVREQMEKIGKESVN
jgi:integrase